MKITGVIASMGMLGVAAAGYCDVDQPTTQQSTPDVTPAATTTTSSTSSPAGNSSFARFFDQDRFHAMFPDAVPLYNFNGLVNAANKYTTFANTGNDTNDKRELAAFLAQTAHESDNFKAAEEYARNTYTVWQYCDNSTIPCAPGRRYHGRGPIQLSWNYNYYHAGEALGIDLLDNPDIVANDTAVTWMTALWYWMTPQGGRVIHDVVAGENGFAQSTDIINGALECGPSAPNKINEQQRIKYYAKMCEALDVQPLGNSSCNA
ncbi:putative chitinase [Phytophthora cinnamomi]|uniref:putative chitinase n=1 Tax=Phytophthora cinnamomi TaxID=4785 RepID=UPI00355AB6F7|nr:putative chitinase [Phytophthora cinnamomi]